MAKDKDKEDTVFKQSEEKPDKIFKQSESKKYLIMFKQNRTFELYVGRSYFLFPPFGVNEVPGWVLSHPDFIQQQKYFTIKEI